MKMSSPAFASNTPVPTPYTSQGPNINPPLRFSEVPATAKSLVLIFEDIDASPKAWTHWLVFNIPPTTLEVAEGEIPKGGVEGIANGGTHGYEGPAPQYFTGTHRYYFRLYALDTVLDLPNTANKTTVQQAMEKHVLAEAVWIGLCEGNGSAIT